MPGRFFDRSGRTWKWAGIGSLVQFFVWPLAIVYGAGALGVRLNVTPSMPIGLYRITADPAAPFVEFCPPFDFGPLSVERGYMLVRFSFSPREFGQRRILAFALSQSSNWAVPSATRCRRSLRISYAIPATRSPGDRDKSSHIASMAASFSWTVISCSGSFIDMNEVYLLARVIRSCSVSDERVLFRPDLVWRVCELKWPKSAF